MSGLHVTVVGGGMITQDQILPSLYQLQRLGVVGELSICRGQWPPATGAGRLRTVGPRLSGPVLPRFPPRSPATSTNGIPTCT